MKLSGKNEFILLDYFRVVFAFFILVLHFKPFFDINQDVDYLLSGVITRLAVPFFFILSGFFLKDTPKNARKTVKYLLRLAKLFLVYSAFYIPQTLLVYSYAGVSFIDALWIFIKENIIFGSYIQLWYFKGLFVAVCLLFLFHKVFKLNDKALFALAVILFLTGAAKGPYSDIACRFPPLYYCISFVSRIIPGTRNGVFVGFPFLCVGYLAYNHRDKIKKEFSIIPACVFTLLLIAEGYFLKINLDSKGQDILLFLLPSGFFIFLSLAFVPFNPNKKPIGLHARKLSVLMFGLHAFCHFFTTFIFNNVLGIYYNTLIAFLISSATTVITGEVIIFLSNLKPFGFLNKILW